MDLLGALYRSLFRPLLFALDAERAHRLGASVLVWAHRSRFVRRLVARTPPHASLAVTAFGRTFSTPLGIAAGFDKRAEMFNALGALGFGHVEVGTVTAIAQDGNPTPRLFRLPRDRALINRLGFNNPGADEAVVALRAHAPDGVVLGVNLGKSKVTPIEDAAGDYATSARRLAPFADYLVLNVSSPNTPGLRALQSVEALEPVIDAVRAVLDTLDRRVPLLVKIAPDLADEDVDAVADLALRRKLDGLIATNTTIARDGLGLATPLDEVKQLGAGGLSGPPVRARALAVLRRLHARTNGAVTLVSVGGVSTADDVWESLAAGASLVQVYTAFVYGGPSFAEGVNGGLRARMEREGVTRLADVIGRDRSATLTLPPANAHSVSEVM